MLITEEKENNFGGDCKMYNIRVEAIVLCFVKLSGSCFIPAYKLAQLSKGVMLSEKSLVGPEQILLPILINLL